MSPLEETSCPSQALSGCLHYIKLQSNLCHRKGLSVLFIFMAAPAWMPLQPPVDTHCRARRYCNLNTFACLEKHPLGIFKLWPEWMGLHLSSLPLQMNETGQRRLSSQRLNDVLRWPICLCLPRQMRPCWIHSLLMCLWKRNAEAEKMKLNDVTRHQQTIADHTHISPWLCRCIPKNIKSNMSFAGRDVIYCCTGISWRSQRARERPSVLRRSSSPHTVTTRGRGSRRDRHMYRNV